MIPKIIHYCWFSDDPKPLLIKKCIKSWARCMPDFKFVCWDSKSFDFKSVKYVNEAYKKKQWAFVTDYIRFYAVYKMGGIYLDSDVLVKKKLNIFLDNKCFFGTESLYDDIKYNGMLVNPEPAIFGAEANHQAMKHVLNYYESQNFILDDGAYNKKVCPQVLGEILERYYSYEHKNEFQELSSNIRIYPTSFFCNLNQLQQDNVYAVHQFANSWIDTSDRGLVFKLCKKYALMGAYHKIERIIRKLKS